MPRIRRVEVLALGAVFVLGGLLLLAVPRPAGPGLLGRYWSNSDWTGEPVAEVIGAVPAAGDVLRRFPGASLRSSAEWSGFLSVQASGTYGFATESDDGSWLFVGERLVVDNGGSHPTAVAAGTIELNAGLHPIRVRYFQAGGDLALAVYWTPPGEHQRPLSVDVLVPSAEAAAISPFGMSWNAVALAIPLLWSCGLVYGIGRIGMAVMWRQIMRVTPNAGDRRGVVLVMVVGTALAVWGLGWGLFGDAWAADELPAQFVRDLIAHRLAGGWYDKYPQMHFMLLAVPVSAFVAAGNLWVIVVDAVSSEAAQLAVMRLVSAVMGVGVIGAAYVCGAELGGPRQGVLSALALVLTPLFVYYGKVANLDIPSLCWFGWAVVAFIRIVRSQQMADYVLLGVMAAAAVAAKDQAYANLALMIPAVVVVTGQARTGRTRWVRWAGAVVDRRVLAAGGAAVLASIVCHNLVFNFGGFLDHYRLLSTLGDLAIVPRTPGGYFTLTTLTGRVFAFAFGWPLMALVLLGLWGAMVTPERRWWLWLLVVPLSFHLTFTFVTLYVNDRYLFGGVFVLALFAGAAAADIVQARRWRIAAAVLLVGAFTYSGLRAASINVMMARDSRYAVRAWMQAHAPAGARVGMLGSYLPYLPYPYDTFTLRASVADVEGTRPDYIIVNERFATRYETERTPEGRELLRRLADGTLGYEEVLSRRSPMPAWAVLAAESEFRRHGESLLTNLDKVNPEMAVYRRRP